MDMTCSNFTFKTVSSYPDARPTGIPDRALIEAAMLSQVKLNGCRDFAPAAFICATVRKHTGLDSAVSFFGQLPCSMFKSYTLEANVGGMLIFSALNYDQLFGKWDDPCCCIDPFTGSRAVIDFSLLKIRIPLSRLIAIFKRVFQEVAGMVFPVG